MKKYTIQASLSFQVAKVELELSDNEILSDKMIEQETTALSKALQMIDEKAYKGYTRPSGASRKLVVDSPKVLTPNERLAKTRVAKEVTDKDIEQAVVLVNKVLKEEKKPSLTHEIAKSLNSSVTESESITYFKYAVENLAKKYNVDKTKIVEFIKDNNLIAPITINTKIGVLKQEVVKALPKIKNNFTIKKEGDK